jgi:hypothetical protein
MYVGIERAGEHIGKGMAAIAAAEEASAVSNSLDMLRQLGKRVTEKKLLRMAAEHRLLLSKQKQPSDDLQLPSDDDSD